MKQMKVYSKINLQVWNRKAKNIREIENILKGEDIVKIIKV